MPANNRGNRHKAFIGRLPKFRSGSNKGRLDRRAAAVKFGLSKRQISKAYNNWIQIFRIDGSNLTFSQYLAKMRRAGISPDQVGNGINDYHLSRFGDVGPYRIDTCRFLVKKQNLAEQKKTSPFENVARKYGYDRAREIMRENGRKAHTHV